MNRLITEFWPLLLPALLGFAAVYLLLPKVRSSGWAWGALLGGVALAMLIIRVRATMDAIWQERLLFVLFSAVALAGGFMLITQKNPAHAALSFALVIIATCGLFLLNAAPFLMAATLIIYAGAIIVTFLFVIMLAQQAGLSDADARSREPFLSCLAGFILMGAMLCVIQKTYADVEAGPDMDIYVAKAQRVLDAKDVEEAKAAFPTPEEPDPLRAVMNYQDEVKRFFPKEQHENIDNLEQALFIGKLDAAQDVARLIVERGKEWRAMQLEQRLRRGSLYQPGEHINGMSVRPIAASPFSGVPSHAGPAFDPATGQVKERMPAANVEALGRSLMTDYLVPMLAAGMLLLVATIGAIAIAVRRGEALR